MGARAAAVAAALSVLALVTGTLPEATPAVAGGPALTIAGLVGSPERGVLALSPAQAKGAYVTGSNVLRRLDGSYLIGPVPAAGPFRSIGNPASLAGPSRAQVVSGAVASDRAWLAGGTVPGRTPVERAMAERALLDLHLLTRPDGALVAGERGAYRYVWPRDAAFAAVALAVTGRHDDAFSILCWVAGEQRQDGTWPARSLPGGGPVSDGRAPQLDAVGWFPWAVWAVEQSRLDAGSAAAQAELSRLWPAVAAAADAAAESLDDEGLPRESADWWELGTGVTVETAGALSAGLRAAADLAGVSTAAGVRGVSAAAVVGGVSAAAASTGPDLAAGARWRAAARRLDDAVRRSFGATGYRRTPDGDSGADAGIAVLAPPFAPADAAVAAAVADTARRLRTPSGGLRPGEAFPQDPAIGWTTATGLVMLADAAAGRDAEASAALTWMAASRTSVGALPEKVDAAGRPSMLAPLAWTDALVLLSLVARDTGLPVPPVASAVPIAAL